MHFIFYMLSEFFFQIFNDVRLAAEEEIREHPDDITADVLLGVMEKYRDKQWEIISTEVFTFRN